MFLKKGSHRNKRKWPSCLFFCISVEQPASAHDSGQTKAPPATTFDGVKRRSTCFSFYCFRRKKRSPEDTAGIAVTAPAYKARISIGAEKNAKLSRSISPQPDKPTSGEIEQVLVPQLTPKYEARNRTEPPRLKTAQTPNRRKHGQVERDRPEATITPVYSPARAMRERKIGNKAGLTVLGMTLAVTVICGRVVAVVSLCACLYLVAFLRKPELDRWTAEKMAVSGDADVGSNGHKKRVVMEGFVERSRRKPR